MTNAEYKASSSKQIVDWLIESGWLKDDTGWRLYNKNRVILANHKEACRIQLRRDAATRGIASKAQKLFNEEYVKGIRAGYGTAVDRLKLHADRPLTPDWSDVDSKINELIVSVRNRKPGEDL